MPDKRASRGRIHHLEYELGFRDDPPGPSDAPGEVRYYNPSPMTSVVKEVWTDDYASSIAGPGTHVTPHPYEPATWFIHTDGHEKYTTVRIDPEASKLPSFAALIAQELDDALNTHRDRLARDSHAR